MKSHTNFKNSSEQIANEFANFTTKQELESIQPERASIIDLYRYAGQKYLVILFIGIINAIVAGMVFPLKVKRCYKLVADLLNFSHKAIDKRICRLSCLMSITNHSTSCTNRTIYEYKVSNFVRDCFYHDVFF